ncbi:hypothetical protein D3C86_1709010 [compost metagenome]
MRLGGFQKGVVGDVEVMDVLYGIDDLVQRENMLLFRTKFYFRQIPFQWSDKCFVGSFSELGSGRKGIVFCAVRFEFCVLVVIHQHRNHLEDSFFLPTAFICQIRNSIKYFREIFVSVNLLVEQRFINHCCTCLVESCYYQAI